MGELHKVSTLDTNTNIKRMITELNDPNLLVKIVEKKKQLLEHFKEAQEQSDGKKHYFGFQRRDAEHA